MSDIVCRLPGVKIPKGTDFEVSTQKNLKRVLGKSGTVKYTGESEHATKYALAVKQKDGSIKLVPTQVVDLNVSTEKAEADAQEEYEPGLIWEQRNALGEAFGTKKAKSAIADKSRNRLDATSLEDLEGSIIDRVKNTTSTLPTEKDRAKAFDEGRNIPFFDIETTKVEDIYPISRLVPARELNLIDPSQLEHAAPESRGDHLPYRDSPFVNSRVESTISEGKNVTTRLKLLSYLSLLLAVYHSCKYTNDKQKLAEKLGNPPEEIIRGIIDRFTVPKTGLVGRSRERSFMIDPAHIDKLLSYIFVLILHLEGFQVAFGPLAHELSLRTTKAVSLFRNLGCSIRTVAASQDSSSGKRSGEAKVAKLTAPLTLPDTTKKGGKAR